MQKRRLQFPPEVVNLLCSNFQNQEKIHIIILILIHNIDIDKSEYHEGAINLALEYENLFNNLELETE